MQNKKAKPKHKLPYLNAELSPAQRAEDLISRMTLQEKISQMMYASPAIPRLGIPEHNWWNECLHGVGRAGIATVFPQAIAMAATFNSDLVFRIAVVISDEARAKHHEFSRLGDRGISKGLTFWSPNVNIFRDPRWGRGQETYGEDPHMAGEMGVAFVRGLQGDHPKYLKVVATPKHYAVHSGPEALRHHFDAVVSKKDLRETYLPAFKRCVQEGKAASIMGAYNRTNGEPCCASQTLLQEILREEWGFEGYIVSDCGAIFDIHRHHTVTGTAEQSAALAVNNGCDLNCGKTYESLNKAVEQNLIEEAAIDQAVRRLFEARFRLGMFDPPECVPYAQIDYSTNDAPEHRALALTAAQQSIVLLKNTNGLLPLAKDTSIVAVIGPNGDDRGVLLGNYNGFPSRYVTILDGMRSRVSPRTKVLYAKGCDWIYKPRNHWGYGGRDDFSEALAAAQRADVVIMCLGLNAQIEGEEGSAAISEWKGDRLNIDLPAVQQELLEKVYAVGKPVVLVLLSGSPLAVNWAQEHVPAILAAWYPGEEGGGAIADVLFGYYNPAGRLPVTFVKSLDQLPPFTDYSMKGRTYRYMEEEPLYPFAYGLSYTSFRYSNLALSAELIEAGESIVVTGEVQNTGSLPGDEVVQLYLSHLQTSVPLPRWELKAFTRIGLAPGEKHEVSFTLAPRQMAVINNRGRCILEPGSCRVYLGGCQPDPRSRKLTGKMPVSACFRIRGETTELAY